MQKEVRARLQDAQVTLRTLETPAQGYPGHDARFFENLWNTRKAHQLDAMNEQKSRKQEMIALLLGLEEELIGARERLRAIQATRSRAQTYADNNDLMALPATVADVEEQIEGVATALGGPAFRALAGATDSKTNALIAISIARSNLYEAKVGLIESRLRRHHNTGQRHAQYNARQLSKKTANLRVKYQTYERKVLKYHTDFPRATRVQLPELGFVMQMSLEDAFWNRGEVNEDELGEHADKFRAGIDATLLQRSALEELRRIAREVRQMIGWANEYHERIMSFKTQIEEGKNNSNLAGDSENDAACRTRKRSLYTIISRRSCKLWKNWSRDLHHELQETRGDLAGCAELDEALEMSWGRVCGWAEAEWNILGGAPVIRAEEPDLYEEEEDHWYDHLYDMNGEVLGNDY
ncbi:uncharacterized protein MELLADRAFT_95223 [Melampsora larici-populina 98AG31]|uniref:Uncharacterized protein n=1 Tax=Melampsora larici-populina (strain 98AG31 / pathotype 3-4-7) TaxID=747676 RepID=F4RCK9_MELLP|nr:uncharacterized protein MELLADRAFT_95223 [Melampsora larici-populina 98AG31]EGG09946.1 hypothetical protein MELLADRAFT_95223 [Melampsora larici-populina 98AG31]